MHVRFWLVFSLSVLILAGGIYSFVERVPNKQHSQALQAHLPVAAVLPVGSGASRLIKMPGGFDAHHRMTFGEARLHMLKSYVCTIGQVQPNANTVIRISSPVTGKVGAVLACLGDRVVSGQTLVNVVSQDLEQLQAEMLQAQQAIQAELDKDLIEINFQIQQAKAQLQLSKKVLDRAQLLVEEKIGSQAALDMAKAQYEKDLVMLTSSNKRHEKTIAIAGQRKLLSRESYEQKLQLLGMSQAAINMIEKNKHLNPLVSVKSPHVGIVLERFANVGELIERNKLLFTVDDLDTVWLVAEVYEKDIAAIRVGQDVEFKVESFPQRTFYGRLSHVAASVNPDTRTLSVRVEVQNPGMILKPKMFASINIVIGEHQVLCIPTNAIQSAGSYKVVYVPLNLTDFEERRIKTGIESGGFIQVVAGLKPGDQVVTSSTLELRAQSLRGSD